jgi:hypothetical protein
MADITVTAASVVPGSNATQIQGTAGETITAGMAVYLKSTDTKWWKAQADGTSAESGVGSNTLGIALCGASAGQPIVVDVADSTGITIGATVAAGTVYVVSATAGGICPEADITAGQYLSILGVGSSTTVIKMLTGGATGIAHA